MTSLWIGYGEYSSLCLSDQANRMGLMPCCAGGGVYVAVWASSPSPQPSGTTKPPTNQDPHAPSPLTTTTNPLEPSI